MVSVSFLECQQENEFFAESEIDDVESLASQEDKILLGKQLENPYSIANMKKALEHLKANGRIGGNFDIRTTDLYVRFLPTDSIQLEGLESDTTIELFDHPLEFEIEQEGNWYHDPSIPDHLPTYQYSVVINLTFFNRIFFKQHIVCHYG